MSIKRIHVNQGSIRSNAKHGAMYPVCRVEDGRRTRYGDAVVIHGPSTMVYRPNDPLPCGAKVWIETEAKVDVVNERPWREDARPSAA